MLVPKSLFCGNYKILLQNIKKPYSLLSLEEAVAANPTLSKISPKLLQQAHETFTNHGFRTKQFLDMVTVYPELIRRDSKEVLASMESWRSCQFGEKHLLELIKTYPTLLDILNERELLVRVTLLKEYAKTNKNVWRLLMNSPNLISDRETTIQSKFDYLQNIMGLDIPEIVKSKTFSKSCFEIECRHVFLERLGIFKPCDESTKNPRLYQIMDSDEKKFATKIAMVTLSEYEAFKQYFVRELDIEKDSHEARKSMDE